MIDQIQWGSMDVNGRVYEESLSDIQDFYVRNKLIARKYTREELGPPDWATALAAKLGPFTLAHDDGRPGCRYRAKSSQRCRGPADRRSRRVARQRR